MKILCLYNNNCAIRLFSWLEKQGNECFYWTEEIDTTWIRRQQFDLVVSYTYSKIIKAEVISILKGNIVNLHTSYLPFNRGVDPNMWSLIDGTPRGVTLHYIDEKLDSGFVIAQTLTEEIDFNTATLRTTYNQLDDAAFKLFKEAFKNYQYWNEMKKKVIGKGTYHTDKQGVVLREHITTFDMSVLDFLQDVKNLK